MDFYAAEYENFNDMVSEFALQLTFRKLPIVEFWWTVKKEYPQSPKKLYSFFSNHMYM